MDEEEDPQEWEDEDADDDDDNFGQTKRKTKSSWPEPVSFIMHYEQELRQTAEFLLYPAQFGAKPKLSRDKRQPLSA